MKKDIETICYVWDELRDAKDGKAHFGGHITEIYAERVGIGFPSPGRNYFADKAHLLAQIALIFREKHPESMVLIDGLEPFDWLRQNTYNFTHRVKVEVKPFPTLETTPK